mgnify:CR=1 FL=1
MSEPLSLVAAITPFNHPLNQVAHKLAPAIAAGVPVFQDRSNLILWGEKDWCFTPAFREEWERRLPEAECHAHPRGVQYPVDEAPQEIDRHLRSCL